MRKNIFISKLVCYFRITLGVKQKFVRLWPNVLETLCPPIADFSFVFYETKIVHSLIAVESGVLC